MKKKNKNGCPFAISNAPQNSSSYNEVLQEVKKSSLNYLPQQSAMPTHAGPDSDSDFDSDVDSQQSGSDKDDIVQV